MTTKLYWHDSQLTQFSAQVVDCFVHDGHQAVVLDQSAFYPGGGGQPHDTGAINATRVVAVSMTEDGRMLHHLEGDVPFKVGETVAGVVDWPRRLEMLQQHTGQHILSQAFFQLFGAETRGFRIFEQVAEIDLTLDGSPDELATAIGQAEELANAVVFEDRAVRLHTVTPAEAAQLPLRKENFNTDCVRVIEIADFDWSPCGGTHARRTGEVGLIAVRGWERAKRMTRVQFVCGGRALRDYRAANQTATSVARRLSVGRDEALEAVAQLLEEHKKHSNGVPVRLSNWRPRPKPRNSSPPRLRRPHRVSSCASLTTATSMTSNSWRIDSWQTKTSWHCWQRVLVTWHAWSVRGRLTCQWRPTPCSTPCVSSLADAVAANPSSRKAVVRVWPSWSVHWLKPRHH